MDMIKAMTAFTHAARLGGHGPAARALHTTQSNVSKLVAALEQRLGGQLFERSTRPLTLTARGRRFQDQAHEILAALDLAQREFASEHREISGSLRIAASAAFGRTQIVPALPGLLSRYPKLNIDLRLSDLSADLVCEGIDLAFRVSRLNDSDLITKRLGRATRLIVASPDYLNRCGRPQHPSDLAHHDCIHFAGINAPRRWRFLRGGEEISVSIRGQFEADASDAIREAAVHGIGIAQLPAWVLRADIQAGRLKTLLEGFTPPSIPIHVVMPRSVKDTAKVRVALAHFEANFAQLG